MVDCSIIQEFLWDDNFDHLLHNFFPQLFYCDYFIVLYRDDNCVDSDWYTGTFLIFVFNGNLKIQS